MSTDCCTATQIALQIFSSEVLRAAAASVVAMNGVFVGQKNGNHSLTNAKQLSCDFDLI
jgi:hypothetical protein